MKYNDLHIWCRLQRQCLSLNCSWQACRLESGKSAELNKVLNAVKTILF